MAEMKNKLVKSKIVERYLAEEGLTLGQLAKRCGIGLRNINKIANLDGTVGAFKVMAVAEVVGVGMQNFVDEFQKHDIMKT